MEIKIKNKMGTFNLFLLFYNVYKLYHIFQLENFSRTFKKQHESVTFFLILS